MKWSELTDIIGGVNLCSLRLALKRPQSVGAYMSYCLRKYDEMVSRGLPHKDPIAHVCEQGWGAIFPDDRVVIPPRLVRRAGVKIDELLILATVTRVLKPKKIFEFGTYMGRTTSVFIINAPRDAIILTLDLPPECDTTDYMVDTYIDTDLDLINRRKLGAYLYEIDLEGRYQQILCDSLQFDPSPHHGSVELGFIDGAHAIPYVKNDTLKMATMLAERGLVFWHDYGGKGRFRPLARYLESLAETIPIYRVYDTTLAWACASDLRKLGSSHNCRGTVEERW